MCVTLNTAELRGCRKMGEESWANPSALYSCQLCGPATVHARKWWQNHMNLAMGAHTHTHTHACAYAHTIAHTHTNNAQSLVPLPAPELIHSAGQWQWSQMSFPESNRHQICRFWKAEPGRRILILKCIPTLQEPNQISDFTAQSHCYLAKESLNHGNPL